MLSSFDVEQNVFVVALKGVLDVGQLHNNGLFAGGYVLRAIL